MLRMFFKFIRVRPRKTILTAFLFSGVIFFTFLLFISAQEQSPTKRNLSGRVDYQGPVKGKIIVRLYKLNLNPQGKPRLLTKGEIYGEQAPLQSLVLPQPGGYSFSQLKPGYYSVIAFLDEDKNREIGFNPSEPLGWYAAEAAGRWAAIDLRKADFNQADLVLRQPVPFPRPEKKIAHGTLRWLKGLPVLHLWGTAEERGFAHGYLIGPQIIDFFEYYVLEDSWRSARRYEEIFVPFLKKNFNYPAEYLRECQAVIKGMRAAGTDMRVKSLGREFGLSELLAINAYIERRAAFPVKEPAGCTQFAFWGPLTQRSELRGGLLAARNMDGECDLRKVTVSHFLLQAVEPSEPGCRRWVSAMWPGFVGTISGVNEAGLYSMENAGGTGPGPVVKGIVPCSWIQRYLLETQGQEATPESVLAAMEQFKNESGGITAPGSIILWAVPYRGQPAPAFVWEGDRFGGVMRRPTEVRPKSEFNIMAANHHLIYGYNPAQPGFSFGRPVYFSSRWRYEVGCNILEAWSRTGQSLGVAEAIRLLQSVAHGTTEYAVIFLANEGRLLVAVDDLKPDLWDAPYLKWVEFKFDELFFSHHE